MRRRIFFYCFAFLFSVTSSLADIIILKSGGKIYSAEWWFEGSEFKYIGYGGVYGIAANEIADIIPSEPIKSEPVREDQSLKVEPIPQVSSSSSASRIEYLEQVAEHLSRMAKQEPGKQKELELQAAKAYTNIGNFFLEHRNYEEAISYYRKAIERCPSFLAPRINLSSSYMATGHTQEALPLLIESLSEHPDDPSLHQILGDVYYMMDRIDEAISEWEKSLEIRSDEKISKKIMKAKKELILVRDFQVTNAAHFTLKFDGDKHPAIGHEILSSLEESFDDLVYTFNHFPSFTTTVILYPDKAFYDITEAPKWVGGLYDGKIRIPIKGLTRLTGISKKTLRHELAHVFIFSKTNGNCPSWFHEGIAQIIEGRTAPDYEMIKDDLIHVHPQWLQDNLNYPVSHSLVSFLEERYSFFSINMILDELGKGNDFEESFKKAIGLRLIDFIQEWKDSFSRQKD